MTVISLNSLPLTIDPTAAALWDVSLPLEVASERPRRRLHEVPRTPARAHSDLVVLENVSKTFPAQGKSAAVAALKNVSLSVRAGEIYGIIGRSGAGKSTLIRLINGLDVPDEGGVQVARVDLAGLQGDALRRQRQSIGMIFQHFNLLASRTVFGNIALPLELAGARHVDIERRVAELLDLVGLADKRDAYPAELSGGQKQRVAIARALATRPSILLSDEATSALDPETARSILALLAEINHKLGVTIILITHQMAVIKEVCHRVGVMDDGHLIEEAEVYDFFANPRSLTARALIGHAHELALPENIRRDLTPLEPPLGDAILRLSLAGPAAEKPVLSHIARESGIDLALLQGELEQIRGRPLGTFLVRAPATSLRHEDHAGDLDHSLLGRTLRRHEVQAELLGYVA